MKVRAQFHRDAEVSRIQAELERNGSPRLQMSLLVALTGGSGFFTSFLLLRAGLVEMWLRYLASFCVAYVIFLCLLWLWLKSHADRRDEPGRVEVGLSGDDAAAIGHSGRGCTFDTGGGSRATSYRGKGGTFDGAGASATFETPAKKSRAVDKGRAVGVKTSGEAEDSGDFAIMLIIILVVAAVLLSSLFVIYSAPALFAELIVDGLLSASLVRKLRGVETRHWLGTALRKTALPFFLTAVVVCASGWALSRLVPGAHSIGQVIAQVR